jgi:hypothetical protein
LRVRRLDPPTRAPWTQDQIAARAAHILLEDGPAMYVWKRFLDTMTPNMVAAPFGTGDLGGLVAQMVSFARVRLTDDQAYIFHVNPAGAAFHNIQLNDFWFNAVGDYVSQTSNLNGAQSLRNPDGTITCVLSIRDPGVHNWLDPNGLHDLCVVLRWQRLPPIAEAGVQRPSVSGELIAFSSLSERLGSAVPSIDAAGRTVQLAERHTTYQLRLVDR